MTLSSTKLVLVVFLGLQSVVRGATIKQNYPECSSRGISMEVSGVVEEMLLPDQSPSTIVLVESSKEVFVECRADIPVVLSTNFETAKSKNGSKKERLVLWKENETNFWSSKNVTCQTENATCSINLTLANPPNNVTNCTVTNENFVCDIREWYQEVQKIRSGDKCVEETLKPKYMFSFYNTHTQNWTDCQKSGVGEEKSFDNVSQIFCDVDGQYLEEEDNLIIRLRKTYMSTGFFQQNTVSCEESTYLAITGDYFVMNVKSGAIGFATEGAIILIATVFLLVTIFCCIRQIKARKNSQAVITYTKGSNSFLRANEDESPREGAEVKDNNITVLDSDDVTIIMDEQREKDAYNKLLDGNISELNPNMLVNKQTRVLQYDRTMEIPREAFSLDFIIGGGQYGTVYRATARGLRNTNSISKVAVKQVKNIMDENQWTTILDELKILSYLDVHYNLVNLVAANTADIARHELFLLLEYCPFGDMKTFLMDKKEEFLGSLDNKPGHLESEFNWNLLMTWTYSIACGMDYLASKKIMHGDLAARNILIGHNYSAKISDFGLSKMMYYNEDYKKTERRLIPWAWMAVEYLQTGQFNLMSDVWSFGVTVWEIFSLGHKPYGLESYECMKVRILEGERLESPRPLELHPQGVSVYEQVMLPCWRESPSSRPNFSDLKEPIMQFLGEEALNAYKADEKMYLTSVNNVETKPKSDSVPSGYIRVESMEKGDQSLIQQSGYIQVKGKPWPVHQTDPTAGGSEKIKETQRPNLGSAPVTDTPGYSRAVTTDKGYIQLSQVNQQ